MNSKNHGIDRMNGMRGAGVALVTGLVLAVAGCGGSADGSEAPEGEAATQAGFARVINVEVRTLEASRFVEQVRLTGVVAADRDVTVAAEESGRVVEVLAVKGAWGAEGGRRPG